MQENYRTFFIRHTLRLDIDKATRDLLWNERRVAIHYPLDINKDESRDSVSLDPDKYEGRARSAIWYINDLAENGGYVCADYFGHKEVLVGKVPSGSQVEIVRGGWESIPGRDAYLKTVKLTQDKTISPASCAPIMAARPRQGTIMYWHKAGSAIKRIVEGERSEIELSDLSPDHQEVLCSEYLRQPDLPHELPQLTALLMPIGRTLKDIDILGLSGDGRRICAQVTYKEIGAEDNKLKKLVDYSDSHTCLVMFCGNDKYEFTHGVHFVPLQTIFDWMKQSTWSGDWEKYNFHGV
jgi:hypothetical protein